MTRLPRPVTAAAGAPGGMLPLPRLLLLTDGSATGGRPLVDVVAAAVEGGARAVLLREKHLPADERAALAAGLRAVLATVGGLLLVASDSGLATRVGADGLHLAAADPVPDRPTARLGRSCHSVADVARAAAEGCAYATLSPIHETASKPGYGPALGTDVLRDTALPVWGLGGIDPDRASACVAAGAAGVAVMGAVMRADDPAAAVRALCRSLGEAA